MTAKWINRFEIKPGRWVFEPSDESIVLGRRIKEAVEDAWRPPTFFYHLRPGGHVEAIRSHVANTHFLRVDIQDFFGCVNRSRLTRCLKSRVLGGYATARSWATASTVVHPDSSAGSKRYVVPYGFVQSPLLASLALNDSRLGKVLRTVSRRLDFSVSVYVDDILISARAAAALEAVFAEIRDAAARSAFVLNLAKCSGPATAVTAFNIELMHNSLQVSAERMQRFQEAYVSTSSQARKAGIRGYVNAVNPSQAQGLADEAGVAG